MADSTDIELGGRPNAINCCDESCVSTCRVLRRMKRDRIYRTDAAVLTLCKPHTASRASSGHVDGAITVMYHKRAWTATCIEAD